MSQDNTAAEVAQMQINEATTQARMKERKRGSEICDACLATGKADLAADYIASGLSAAQVAIELGPPLAAHVAPRPGESTKYLVGGDGI